MLSRGVEIQPRTDTDGPPEEITFNYAAKIHLSLSFSLHERLRVLCSVCRVAVPRESFLFNVLRSYLSLQTADCGESDYIPFRVVGLFISFSLGSTCVSIFVYSDTNVEPFG